MPEDGGTRGGFKRRGPLTLGVAGVIVLIFGFGLCGLLTDNVLPDFLDFNERGGRTDGVSTRTPDDPLRGYPTLKNFAVFMAFPSNAQKGLLDGYHMDPGQDWFDFGEGEPTLKSPQADLLGFGSYRLELGQETAPKWSQLLGCGPAEPDQRLTFADCPWEQLAPGGWVLSVGYVAEKLPPTLPDGTGGQYIIFWDLDGNAENNFLPNPQQYKNNPFLATDFGKGLNHGKDGFKRFAVKPGPQRLNPMQVEPQHGAFVYQDLIWFLAPATQYGEADVAKWRAFAGTFSFPPKEQAGGIDTIPDLRDNTNTLFEMQGIFIP